MTRFTAIDPAISLKERADFTAIVTIGIDVLGKIYVLEVKRGHYTEDQMVEELFLTYERYHPINICIETVAFQKTLQHYIMKEIKRRGRSLPLNEVLPESDESKEKRLRLLQPMYMRSDIFHSKSVPNIEYLEDELLRFPKGKNDDVCLIGNTIVKVKGGDKKIKDVKKGDFVLTRYGYKKVLKSWCTGKKKVITRLGITGTPSHKIITKYGTKELTNVRVSDTLYIWNEKQSCIEEKNTIDILIQKIANHEFTFGDMINNILHPLHFTGKFGLITLERFLLDSWFTTKMRTLLITNRLIWKLCQKMNTQGYMLLNLNAGRPHEYLLIMPENLPKSGTEVQKVEPGINYILRNSGKIQKLILKSVYNVVKFILLFIKTLVIVKNSIVELSGGKKTQVYNLQVEGSHEFLANGVLVHNCDAMAYAVRASFPPRQKEKEGKNKSYLY
jgi:predicted phage terminase large subunit-like protein